MALFSFRFDINGKRLYRRSCYFCILVILILIAGLRYRLGVDTAAYIYSYFHRIPDISHLDEMEGLMLNEPVFYFLCSFVKSLGGKFYIVQLIHAAFVNTLIFLYIKKHSNNIFLCILLYFIWTYTTYMMEEMRASMAVAICLFGNDYILEKKWAKGYLLYVLAFLCHNSAIFLFLTPLFVFLRFNIWGFICLIVIPIIEYSIQNHFNDYILLMSIEGDLTNKASSYLDTDRYFEEHNIFFYLFNIGIFMIYSIWAYVVIRKEKKSGGVAQLQPFIIIGLLFIIMQNNFGIFYRYVSFYKIYFIFFFAEFIIIKIKNSGILSTGIKILRVFILCIPLLYSMISRYKDMYMRYYPYSSIIDKSIDQERETEYKKLRSDFPLLINENEY